MAYQRLLVPAVRSGVTESSAMLIPAGVREVWGMATDIPTAEYEDPLNSIEVRVLRSPDAGVTWHVIGGAIWEGGRRTNKAGVLNPPPDAGVQIFPEWVGQLAKVELTVPRPMTFGVAVDIRTAV